MVANSWCIREVGLEFMVRGGEKNTAVISMHVWTIYDTLFYIDVSHGASDGGSSASRAAINANMYVLPHSLSLPHSLAEGGSPHPLIEGCRSANLHRL